MPRQTVARPIEASITPIRIAFYPEEEVLRGGWQEPDYNYRPPAVFGWCRVTFHFGRFVCSKNISGRFIFNGHYHDDFEPTAGELAIAAAEVDRQIVERLAEHGLNASAVERIAWPLPHPPACLP